MAQPRTWRISTPTSEWDYVVWGEMLKNESVRVVEMEPVLDLLERANRWCIVANIKEPESAAVIAEIRTFLREHNHLTEEAS